MSTYMFYIFAALLVLASLCVVLARNPLYNVLSLVVAVFSLSSLFIFLEAYFVGIILLLVYAGAVLVFFLFVVMCLNLQPDNAVPGVSQRRFRLMGLITSGLFLNQFFWVIKSAVDVHQTQPSSIRGTIENVGRILFTDYLLPFELTSFLLLIAVFGIVSLAQGVFNTGKKANP